MSEQDRKEFEAWAEHAYGPKSIKRETRITRDYASHQIEMQWIAWQASRRAKSVFEALAHARNQTAELRAMLDELLLSVQGENIYLCDEVWAVADRIAAQPKEQDDE